MVQKLKAKPKAKVKAKSKAGVKRRVNAKPEAGSKPKAKSRTAVIKASDQKKFIIKKVSFNVEGLKCGGNLFLPDGVKKPPVVIMAHGFGAEMTFGIPVYAEKYAKNGFAVLTFDYRYYGESEGEPRHFVSTKAQLNDWTASIEFVRGLKEVDGERICIWGYSYSGGHVIVTAARNRKLKAFISHVPFMDSIAFMNKSGFKKVIKVNAAAFVDLYNSITGRSPHSIPIVGRPEVLAMLNTPECNEGYMAMIPVNFKWDNGFPARSVFRISWYRPIKYIHELKCKGLVVFGENDSLTDADMVEKEFVNMPDIKLLKLSSGHFNLFKGEYFQKAVAEEIHFLKSFFK